MDPRWRDPQPLAMRQHGRFTTPQAEAAGLTRPALHYQVRAGVIVRRLRGVCRFAAYPPGDVVVHEADLAAGDIHHEGVHRYTTPLRTLLDVVSDAYPDDQRSGITFGGGTQVRTSVGS